MTPSLERVLAVTLQADQGAVAAVGLGSLVLGLLLGAVLGRRR